MTEEDREIDWEAELESIDWESVRKTAAQYCNEEDVDRSNVEKAFALYEWKLDNPEVQELADKLDFSVNAIKKRRDKLFWTIPEELSGTNPIVSLWAREMLSGANDDNAERVRDAFSTVAKDYADAVDAPTAIGLSNALGIGERAVRYRIFEGDFVSDEVAEKYEKESKIDGPSEQTYLQDLQKDGDTDGNKEDSSRDNRPADSITGVYRAPVRVLEDVLPGDVEIVDVQIDGGEMVVQHEVGGI